MNKAIVDYIAKANEAKAALEKIGKDAVKELFNDFFAANPNVTALMWTQYTPYFNDGDSCDFGVNDVSASTSDIAGLDPEEILSNCSGYDDDDIEVGDKRVTFESAWGIEDEGLKKQLESISSVLCGPLEQVCLQVFDDHQKILVTRDGVFQTEYSHD